MGNLLCQDSCSSALCIVFVGKIHLEWYHFGCMNYEITPPFYIVFYMSLFFHRPRPQGIWAMFMMSAEHFFENSPEDAI